MPFSVLINKVLEDVGSGLFDLYLKGLPSGELFITSRKWMALEGQSVASRAPDINIRIQYTKEMVNTRITYPKCVPLFVLLI